MCQLQKEMPIYPFIWLLEKDKEVVRYKGAKRADAYVFPSALLGFCFFSGHDLLKSLQKTSPHELN